MAMLTHRDVGSTSAPKTQSTGTALNPGPQHFVVEQAPNLEDRMAQFQSAPDLVYKMPPPKPVSKDLEKLIFIGRLSEVVEVGGSKFEISTLTNRENSQVLKTLYKFKEASDLFEIRVITLANCLRKIDGVALNDIEIEGEFESDFHKRISIIDNLQLFVVEFLYEAYEKLAERKEQKEGEADKELKNS